MPNHPGSNLIMICTGTGSAPMRAMTERRRRRVDLKEGGKLMLFFGARTQKELPYFGPLMNLPKDFIDINFAFSREEPSSTGEPHEKRYVQHALRERAPEVVPLLKDADTYVYVCGLKGMEAGVLSALRDICAENGLDWPALHAEMKKTGRLHFETY
jgi:benzoyl-CoA 2,3-dioxygenase component A